MIRRQKSLKTFFSFFSLLFLALLGSDTTLASTIPEMLDSNIIGCNPPKIGTTPGRTDVGCYHSELTNAKRDLRNLYRDLHDQAGFDERRKLRQIETSWRTLVDNQCQLVGSLESNITNAINVKAYCQAILTRLRVMEFQELTQHILDRSSSDNNADTSNNEGLILVPSQ